MIGHAKGYRTVIVIPETQSPEKISLLRTLGAEVITVPEKPYSDPGNYNRVAQRLAGEKGWFWANQFDNTGQPAGALPHDRAGNLGADERRGHRVRLRRRHRRHAGGHSTYLKERNPRIATVCADPYGAAMWSWFTHGHTDIKDGDSIAEGIGQTRVTKNLEGVSLDRAYRIEDQPPLPS